MRKEKTCKAVRSRTRQRGFTLIELLVVVIIAGILTAIAIPSINNQRKSAAFRETRAALEDAVDVMNSYLAVNYGEMPNLQIACHRDGYYSEKGGGYYTPRQEDYALPVSAGITVSAAAIDYSVCTFPCNQTACNMGGTSTSTYDADSETIVRSTHYSPAQTFDKSSNVEIVYEPCYFAYGGQTGCDTADAKQPTTRNFVVYAYNDKIESGGVSAHGGIFVMYKSTTGKFYRGYNTNVSGVTAPATGCEEDSAGLTLCELP